MAHEQSNKGLLKLVACGSVDDGKSTLIGNMLYDAKLIFADQAQALELESKAGSANGELDYSLLLDGLAAEREQGITIDVAYRYFNTDKRNFIVADAPGHVEYTRNMAVGASFADLAVILVDATKGLLTQTCRHTRICALMGITHFVFAVNKMDLVGYNELSYQRVREEILDFAAEFTINSLEVIPVAATKSENIAHRSDSMSWYTGPCLLEHLEQVDVDDERRGVDFTLPVQRVCRPNSDFRGFQGTIASGTIAVGDSVRILPSGTSTHIKGILVAGSEADAACAGQAVTVTFEDEVDASRGDVIVRTSRAEAASLFTVRMLWMDDIDLLPGKNYLFKIGTKSVPGTVIDVKHCLDVTSGDRIPSTRVRKNELAECDISLGAKVVYEPFASNRTLGSMILIDRLTNATAGCGIINHKLNRSDNLTWHETDITRGLREKHMGQQACTLWFTGLSGSGKSTVANAVEKRLHALGKFTMLLDGDNVRLGLNRNLGFTEEDRIENIRRIAEVAKLMNDAGLIAITSFISPFVRDRRNAKEIIGQGSFVEVFVSTPIEVCEQRDVKGLYAKARRGEIANFTGVTSPYEAPAHPDITVDTSQESLDDAVERIVKFLLDRQSE